MPTDGFYQHATRTRERGLANPLDGAPPTAANLAARAEWRDGRVSVPVTETVKRPCAYKHDSDGKTTVWRSNDHGSIAFAVTCQECGIEDDGTDTRPVLWALILPGDPVLYDDVPHVITEVTTADLYPIEIYDDERRKGYPFRNVDPADLTLDLDRIHENPIRQQHPDLTP